MSILTIVSDTTLHFTTDSKRFQTSLDQYINDSSIQFDWEKKAFEAPDALDNECLLNFIVSEAKALKEPLVINDELRGRKTTLQVFRGWFSTHVEMSALALCQKE